ncbi:hypothetical protein Tco_0835642, partial [Tanacetum coccineum]
MKPTPSQWNGEVLLGACSYMLWHSCDLDVVLLEIFNIYHLSIMPSSLFGIASIYFSSSEILCSNSDDESDSDTSCQRVEFFRQHGPLDEWDSPPLTESQRIQQMTELNGKEHGRIILNSILNEQLVYGTIEVDGVTRTKTYEELSYQKKLQDDCDVRDNNIVLQGLPPDVYSLINHHDVVKDIWDRVRLLMQGIKLSQQKRKCKMYNEFDRFTSVKGKLLHEYYLRFTQLIKAMHAIGMTMQQ